VAVLFLPDHVLTLRILPRIYWWIDAREAVACLEMKGLRVLFTLKQRNMVFLRIPNDAFSSRKKKTCVRDQDSVR
jgi:hypothetical protein